MKTEPLEYIRSGVPTIGRDAALTLSVMNMVRAREHKRLRRQAFWKGFVSVFTIDGWKQRVAQKRLIIKLK